MQRVHRHHQKKKKKQNHTQNNKQPKQERNKPNPQQTKEKSHPAPPERPSIRHRGGLNLKKKRQLERGFKDRARFVRSTGVPQLREATVGLKERKEPSSQGP